MINTGIERAVDLAGSQANLAKMIEVTPVAISNWTKRGWVPLRRAVEIESLLGVPRSELISPRIREMVAEFAG